jgi:hypothetical protein
VRRIRVRTAATALVAAAAALLTVSPWIGSVATSTTVGAGAAAPTATVTATRRAPATGTATTGATSTTSSPSDAAREIPAGTPLELAAAAIGLRARVTPYTDDDVVAAGGAVRPPTLWTVSWWTGGGIPGTGASNTVYLYGHTWREPAVFNAVGRLEPGDAVVLTTTRGRLTYTVEEVFTVSKQGLVDDPRVTTAVAGRLLLIGCHRVTGAEEHTTANVVVSAQLVP